MTFAKIVPEIHSHIAALTKHPREPGNHPSEMCSKYACHRRKVIQKVLDEYGIDHAQPIDVTSQGFFDTGHAAHHWFQERVLGPMGVLEGSWRCRRCLAQHDGFMPESCCGARDFEFIEPSIRIAEHDIVGKCDGILHMPDGSKAILDVKTRKSSLFTGLHAPEPDHVGQITVYMHALGIHDAILLYVKKDNWYDLKEFHVKYEPIVYQRALAEGIYDVLNDYQNNRLPPMGKCTDASYSRKTCWLKGACLGCRSLDDVRTLAEKGLLS